METVAIVLAAGQGKRFKSRRSKVLAPLLGRPMYAYAVWAAIAAGCRRVLVVIGRDADDVAAHVRSTDWGAPVLTVSQPEQRGTGHAVACALAAGVTEPVALILYGDVPTLRPESLGRLLALKAERRAPLALVTTRPDDPTGYGRVLRDARGEVRAIIEHADASEAERALGEVNAGVYAVDRNLLAHTLGTLDAHNRQGEQYLPDIVPAAAGGGGVATLALPYAEVAGVNDRTQLRWATAELQRRIVAEHEQRGVTFAPEPLALVEPGVTIGMDAEIGPGVLLRGATTIGAGAQIEGYCVLDSVTIGEQAQVRAYSHLREAEVGARAIVGPLARLRPGARLAAEVHVGNFVEVKNSTLAAGVKANHLSYLGDADVGAGSNIGAGTITCNYDGQRKHRTDIGAGCFVGSNATLVAPLTLGDGAYVGAGSVLTVDVPADALALGRATQVNKPELARRLRRPR